ncbi:MAG: DUF1343 domain-containing protein [Opitutales bacterium]|nr:DUF1343 domain-containing protein [Opitutales bacterium]MBT5814800.1 DUF1343 domain-containing protein [Opitutales bacterium]
MRIRIENRNAFKPHRLGVALLITVARVFPNDFKWCLEAYEFIGDVAAFNLLYGDGLLRKVIERAFSVRDLLHEREVFENGYRIARKEYLRY